VSHRQCPITQSYTGIYKARVTLRNTHNNFGLPVSVPSTVLVHTNTTTYSQHAYTLPSASTCSDLCHNESQRNCIMATYKNSTELCLLHINMQDIKGVPKSAQCPLGLPSSGYEKADDPAGDGAGFEDADGDGQEAVWMDGPCLDPGDGSVGCAFGEIV